MDLDSKLNKACNALNKLTFDAEYCFMSKTYIKLDLNILEEKINSIKNNILDVRDELREISERKETILSGTQFSKNDK